jgi:hypothetical protein
MINALRKVKQRVYNDMVEGNGDQPAGVVDSVVYAIRDLRMVNSPRLTARPRIGGASPGFCRWDRLWS